MTREGGIPWTNLFNSRKITWTPTRSSFAEWSEWSGSPARTKPSSASTWRIFGWLAWPKSATPRTNDHPENYRVNTPTVETLLDAGLRVGEWVAAQVDWGCSGDEFDVMLLHPAGHAVYLPVFMSGWIYWRGPDTGWLVCDSEGGIESIIDPDDMEELVDEVRSRTPTDDWPLGIVTLGNWTFDAQPDRLVAQSGIDPVPFAFHHRRPLWTRAKKPLIVPEE